MEAKAELSAQVSDEKPPVTTDKEEEVNARQEELSKAQAEITRLLDIMKEAEDEKSEKDKQMKEQAE